MALYHLSAKALSRSSGASAVAAAAYRSGEDLIDERTGDRHDYSRRSGVDAAEIIAPDQAPDWVRDRAQLWNAAEAAERRRDSQVAREVMVALPVELDVQEQRAGVREFCRQEFASQGMVADVSYHGTGSENPHAHILLTMRRIEGQGFGKKERAWNGKERLEGWRESWSNHANRALDRAGRSERIDHRTLKEQRQEALDRGDLEKAAELDREPQVHLGKSLYMEAKNISTEIGTRFLEIAERNLERVVARGRQQFMEVYRELLSLSPPEPSQPSQGRKLEQPEKDTNRCMTPGGG